MAGAYAAPLALSQLAGPASAFFAAVGTSKAGANGGSGHLVTVYPGGAFPLRASSIHVHRELPGAGHFSLTRYMATPGGAFGNGGAPRFGRKSRRGNTYTATEVVRGFYRSAGYVPN